MNILFFAHLHTSRRRLARLLAALFCLCGFAQASANDIMLSLGADRSSPDFLQGRSVSGNIYVFMSSSAGVKRVLYYLDSSYATGTPVFTATAAPYDFAGSVSATVAKPYDTRRAINGSHTLYAKVELTAGGSVLVQAQFNIGNPLVALPISDNFSDGVADGWTVFNESREAASSWRVSGGGYREANYVGFFRSALQKGYHVGTLSYLNNSLNLTNYRFSIAATPFSAEGHDIGVMFRFRDFNNYYRLSFSRSDGFTRLEKKVNGVFSTLARNARGYVRGVPLNMTVDARGSLFQVAVNGEKLFSFSDTSLASGGIGLYCRDNCFFDNVSLTAAPTAASVTLAKAESYSVSSSNTIQAAAVVANKPTGTTVAFTLGGQACAAATESPAGYFRANCTAAGFDNQLVANLLSGSGALLASDTHVSVGLRGRNYAAVGDSITWGVGDNFEGDNTEASGLVIANRGYEAPLAQLFNAPNAFNTIVFNNGFPGDTSANILNSRIDSVLERQTDAHAVLLLIGTNDAGANVPSGSGCTGTACNNTFKGNVQKIIDRIAAKGKSVMVALVPPRFDDDAGTGLHPAPFSSAKNTQIANYNQVIRNELVNRIVGPDLFAAFLGSTYNYFNLFADALHPNALGYRVIAQLWYNKLTGGSSFPFILTGICVRPAGGACQNPSPYKQNLLEAGDPYYVDQSFTVTAVPSVLSGGIWVMPANANKTATATNHLQISYNGTATVYVAYDDGEAGRPTWLNGFTNTGLFVTTSNTASPSMRLYRKTGVAGGITLGGNRAAGAGGTPENYLVIVKK